MGSLDSHKGSLQAHSAVQCYTVFQDSLWQQLSPTNAVRSLHKADAATGKSQDLCDFLQEVVRAVLCSLATWAARVVFISRFSTNWFICTCFCRLEHAGWLSILNTRVHAVTATRDTHATSTSSLSIAKRICSMLVKQQVIRYGIAVGCRHWSAASQTCSLMHTEALS